jgi:hypothetical protein
MHEKVMVALLCIQLPLYLLRNPQAQGMQHAARQNEVCRLKICEISSTTQSRVLTSHHQSMAASADKGAPARQLFTECPQVLAEGLRTNGALGRFSGYRPWHGSSLKVGPRIWYSISKI